MLLVALNFFLKKYPFGGKMRICLLAGITQMKFNELDIKVYCSLIYKLYNQVHFTRKFFLNMGLIRLS